MSDADCDAVIIGSGPGGATAAEVLTGAGWSVILLEKCRSGSCGASSDSRWLRPFSRRITDQPAAPRSPRS